MSTTAPSVDEFKVAFPQFASVDDGLITTALSLSTRLLSRAAWGEFYSDAVSLDAAHNLYHDIMLSSGELNSAAQFAVGTISSVSAAGMSTSFNNGVTSNGKASHASDWYSKTVYGQRFLRLKQAVIPSMLLTA